MSRTKPKSEPNPRPLTDADLKRVVRRVQAPRLLQSRAWAFTPARKSRPKPPPREIIRLPASIAFGPLIDLSNGKFVTV